jgi:hypothetical protein
VQPSVQGSQANYISKDQQLELQELYNKLLKKHAKLPATSQQQVVTLTSD